MLSLSGCFNSDECIETICQAEALVEQWQIDPVAAEAALLATTDPIIQIATLRALSEHQPAALSALCPKLSELPARECQQLSGRPHLWDSGSGAVSSLPIEGLVNPWADLPPQEVECAVFRIGQDSKGILHADYEIPIGYEISWIMTQKSGS